jgi:hypothetical protein
MLVWVVNSSSNFDATKKISTFGNCQGGPPILTAAKLFLSLEFSTDGCKWLP